ncbi:MarR family transcriptional regulator [Haloarcula halophila]|uniref:MarR family transcriptional regulator n=1 Tax=Halomicroarcula sp. GCM10025335 TaxID=3252668 RepID=UPI0036D34076
MRKSGKWMTIVDDRVLEYIREEGHGSPTEMKENGPIRYSRQYIAERCRKLADHGLLKPVGNGVYTITERGEAYLDEELDTHEDAPEQELDEQGDENGAHSESNS